MAVQVGAVARMRVVGAADQEVEADLRVRARPVVQVPVGVEQRGREGDVRPGRDVRDVRVDVDSSERAVVGCRRRCRQRDRQHPGHGDDQTDRGDRSTVLVPAGPEAHLADSLAALARAEAPRRPRRDECQRFIPGVQDDGTSLVVTRGLCAAAHRCGPGARAQRRSQSDRVTIGIRQPTGGPKTASERPGPIRRRRRRRRSETTARAGACTPSPCLSLDVPRAHRRWESVHGLQPAESQLHQAARLQPPRDPFPARPVPGPEARQVRRLRAAAAARQEHRDHLREDVDPDARRVRGRGLRPGRSRDLPRARAAPRSATRSR